MLTFDRSLWKTIFQKSKNETCTTQRECADFNSSLCHDNNNASSKRFQKLKIFRKANGVAVNFALNVNIHSNTLERCENIGCSCGM